MPIERQFSFRLPMTETERDMLKALAEEAGMTGTAFIRQLLKREHARRFGAETPSTRRTKGKK